jgi:uncharacterized damage-inducible protein DinB
MPEEKYSYVPAVGKFDGVRSFGEQVKHVACAQFAFFNEFEGKKPPEDCEKGGHDPAKTKAELIKYLKDSFDYSNRVLAPLTANNALDRVEGRYAGPNTKVGIAVIAVWHITDHYGQLVEYLRLNGIVPPMTQKYGLKVRGLVWRRRPSLRSRVASFVDFCVVTSHHDALIGCDIHGRPKTLVPSSKTWWQVGTWLRRAKLSFEARFVFLPSSFRLMS